MSHPSSRAHSDHSLYIASSKSLKLSLNELWVWGEWLDARPHTTRPLPHDRCGFVLDPAGLRLAVPGFKDQYWHPGMALKRIKIGQDALARAMDVKNGTTIVDCTLGMGHDSLVLAHHGARIIGLERQPALLLYTSLGIANHYPELAQRIHGICIDHQTWLKRAPTNSVDHVYMDPMFPPSPIERKSTTWAIFRRLLGPADPIGPDMVTEALRVARKTVILKLAPNERPPIFEGIAPAQLAGSKRVRFACWTKGQPK